jgi:hypothetical protein
VGTHCLQRFGTPERLTILRRGAPGVGNLAPAAIGSGIVFRRTRSTYEGGTRSPQCVGVLSVSGTNRLERAVFRRSLPYEWSEFHLAGDQAWGFKFSFEHQRSCVAPDVSDEKFHRTRESDRVSFTRAPLCLRRLSGPPDLQSWIQQQESTLSVGLRVKTQQAVVLIPEGDLYIPSADHVRRLRLG